MADFLTNKYVTVIPINAMGTSGDLHSAAGLANLHCEFNDPSRTLTHYKATVVYIV